MTKQPSLVLQITIWFPVNLSCLTRLEIRYSGDLNTGMVQYSSGESASDGWMVQIWMASEYCAKQSVIQMVQQQTRQVPKLFQELWNEFFFFQKV